MSTRLSDVIDFLEKGLDFLNSGKTEETKIIMVNVLWIMKVLKIDDNVEEFLSDAGEKILEVLDLEDITASDLEKIFSGDDERFNKIVADIKAQKAITS